MRIMAAVVLGLVLTGCATSGGAKSQTTDASRQPPPIVDEMGKAGGY